MRKQIILLLASISAVFAGDDFNWKNLPAGATDLVHPAGEQLSQVYSQDSEESIVSCLSKPVEVSFRLSQTSANFQTIEKLKKQIEELEFRLKTLERLLEEKNGK